MRTDTVYIKTVLRSIVLLLFLLSGIQSPLLASEMWEDLFEEHMENAEAGDVDAQYELGVMYLKGQSVDEDRDQAVQWLTKAADGGSQRAASKLGRLQIQQDKFEQTVKKAQTGDIEAQYDLAMMYLRGKGVQKNGKLARKWLNKAADKNDVNSITRLGIVNYKGEGGPSDYTRARELFNRVDDTSVLAQYYLGEIYANGAGVEKDYLAAIDWYKKAADGGFDRSEGKIISLQEELRVLNLRKQKRAQEKQRAQQRQQAAKKAVVAKATPRPPVKIKQVVVTIEQTSLEMLAGQQWSRGGKPLEYLPSKLTQCDEDDGGLVCLSKTLTRERGTQTIWYRVRSLVKSENKTFVIVYRNLVLDVEDSQESPDQVLGYDEAVEQGYKVKTGWTREHSVSCTQSSGKQLDCVKDKTHKILLVSEAG